MAQATAKYVRNGHLTHKSTLYCIVYSLFAVLVPLSLAFFTAGGTLADYALAFWGVALLFLANVMYGFLQLRERLLFLFLHFGIALFLLSRPFISVLCNHPDWWLLSSPETTMFALNALYLSMACLLGATALCGAVRSFHAQVCGREKHKVSKIRCLAGIIQRPQMFDKVRYLRIAALACYIICALGAFYAGALKLSYMDGRVYTDFYLADSSSYTPWIVSTLEAMAPFMLCAYLATMPRRRGAVACLVVYVATTLPMLMIGSRSDFVIAFLFAALYFVFRAVTDKNEIWISRRLIIACCVAAPIGIAAMGIMDYLRAGAETNLDFSGLIVDALYKQGVSFTILGRAYDVNDQIQELGFRFFSMGGLIDTFTQGFIGQTFFGFTQLPTTNSYELATQGWSYAHAMSFFAHKNYLGGEGYGSSYLLELFADFGYGGIAVGSLILGSGLFALSRSLGRGWFWGTCALTAASRVFHMPRGYYDEWISYLWSTRFLLAIAALIVISAGLYFVNKHALASRERNVLRGGKPISESEATLGAKAVSWENAQLKRMPKKSASRPQGRGLRVLRGVGHLNENLASVVCLGAVSDANIRKLEKTARQIEDSKGSSDEDACKAHVFPINAYNVAVLR